MGNISLVIGSWGSYNECNERSLGSKWLDLGNYDTWEEIEEELKKQGFELDGIDEELFVQDVEGLPTSACNWDNTHPKQLFETLYEADVLNDDYKYEVMSAYLEVRNFDEFVHLVNNNGSSWDDDIHLWKHYDWEDYGREMFDCSCYDIPSNIENYIDFERYGRDMGECYCEEYSDGLIEICY